jgi:L-aspartate oxidase
VELLVGETDAAPGRRETLHADAVVLATGGAGELYAHSTNPEVATGDGIAAAIRAGAEVADLEFFQFHPTVLEGKADAAALEGKADAAGLEGKADAAGLEGKADAAGPEGKADAAGPAVGDSFLVSEAVRGEGATLVDENGRRFVVDAHPDGELAPRDVVARAIARQMDAQGGRPVLLDATHIHSADADARAAFLARRFPTIDRAVRERGLDWAREPIPVTPAAHYLMGGVATDLFGRTSLPGLYAVGEVARTGVHGANRLASNSLLEGAVFGARAGDVIAADAASGAWTGPKRSLTSVLSSLGGGEPTPPDALDERASRTRGDTDPTPAAAAPFSRRALQQLMWEDAGLVRDEGGLAHAASLISHWRAQLRTPVTEHEFEDENLLLVAARVVAAACARRESVGAHFRSDDPATATLQDSRAAATTVAPVASVAALRRSSERTVAEEAVAC